MSTWEKSPHPPPEGDALFDAVLRPNRSMSRKAFTIFIGFVIACNLAMTVYFVSQGAWPVLGFLALDVALIWLAFTINYRDGRVQERVYLAADRLQVSRQGVRGPPSHYVTHPLWARLVEDPRAVRIAAGPRSLVVASFLSPPEREAFAEALGAALARAKRGEGYRPSTSAIE